MKISNKMKQIDNPSPTKKQQTKSEKLASKHQGTLPSFAVSDLSRSGLAQDTIEEMRVFSGNGDSASLMREILGFSSIDGASIPQASPDSYFLPYLHTDGYCRLKLAIPLDGAKYLSPSRQVYDTWHVYFLPGETQRLARPGVPLVLTEGEKKTAKLTQELRNAESPATAAGFPGVTMWEHCAEWRHIPLSGREVYIAFDADHETKKPVQIEIVKLALWLYQKKARPHLLTWGKSTNGIDDFLVAGGSAIELLANANDMKALLAHCKMVDLGDIAKYCARYRYTKSAFKALYDICAMGELYGIKKTTAGELFAREQKTLIEAAQADDERSNLPVIRIEGGRLSAMVDAAESVLLAGDDIIYQRAGKIVRVIEEQETVAGKDRLSPRIVPVEAATLRELITKGAQWQTYDVNRDLTENVNCPKEIAETLLARRTWRLPRLSRVVTAPTLRHDGTVLHEPGYDRETGIFFHSNQTWPTIPENPSPEDAFDALEKLEEVIAEFPFRQEKSGFSVSKSVALSAILTALVRPVLRSAPMFGFTAPKMASGKSLLANLVAMIATGKPACNISQADSPEEEKKRVLSLLLDGTQCICIDNVERQLGSDALCTILTEESWQERILRENQIATVDTKAVFMATGNNLSLNGDLTTRALVCTLDPGVERPEERRFRLNLREYVPEHRGELVVAGLTILKAYIEAGKPKMDIPEFGRFEEWSALVRSALVWLGLPDPCASRAEIESKDPVRERLVSFMLEWKAKFPSSAVTVNDAIKAASTDKEDIYELMLDIAGERGDRISVTRLGKFMKKFQDRVENNMKIVCAGKARGNKSLWTIETLTS